MLSRLSLGPVGKPALPLHSTTVHLLLTLCSCCHGPGCRARRLCRPLPPPSSLQVLRQKAEERNPDEFYFAMEKARTRDGVHVAPTAEANKYSQEELRLMKSQDLGYQQLKAQTEAKVGVALGPGWLEQRGGQVVPGVAPVSGTRSGRQMQACTRSGRCSTRFCYSARQVNARVHTYRQTGGIPRLQISVLIWHLLRLPAMQKVERMQQSLHLIGAPAANKHVVFVDDEEEAQQFDPARHFDTAPELLDRSYNRPRLEQLADARATSAGEAAAAAVARIEK